MLYFGESIVEMLVYVGHLACDAAVIGHVMRGLLCSGHQGRSNCECASEMWNVPFCVNAEDSFWPKRCVFVCVHTQMLAAGNAAKMESDGAWVSR